MRIVHLNYVFERGLGISDTIERYRTLRRVAESQAAAGNEVYVLTRHEVSGFRERADVRYYYHDDNTKRALAQPWTYPKNLHHIANELKPDIVHVHSLKFHPQVRMLRAELGDSVPIVVQHHAERPTTPPLSYLQRYCLESVQGFIFNGKENAEEWLNAGIITDWDGVYEVPEGSSDLTAVPEDQALEVAGLHGAPAVLWVGRMHPAKDPITVLEGFRMFARENEYARLYLVFRDGPLAAEVYGRIEESPILQQAVTIVGEKPYEELAAYYSAADVFVTAAPYEGSNYALIEAMSCGCMSACSKIGPHRYITADGKYAEYFTPGNAAHCAVAIGAAAARLREDLSEEMMKYFSRELSYEAIARKLSGVYGEVIGG